MSHDLDLLIRENKRLKKLARSIKKVEKAFDAWVDTPVQLPSEEMLEALDALFEDARKYER